MRFLLFLFALAASFQVSAQAYPARPVRIVVPLGAGGFADVPARLIAPRLAAELGGTFFVENRPGAGGTIGAELVAKSPPDGETLLFTATPHVISASVYKNLRYDALKDFAPVALVASGPYVLVVYRDMPARSLRELIAAAKAAPGKIDYASSGNGSAQHLVGALFAAMAHVELSHVPYKGSGQAMQDLLGGRVKVSFAGVPNVLSHLQSGRLRALGVTTASRWPDLPEVPTIAEAGVPGYEATLWLCLLAPAGTPRALIDQLSQGVEKALREPGLLGNLRRAGIAPSYLGPEKLGPFLRAEYEKWAKVVRETGATVN